MKSWIPPITIIVLISLVVACTPVQPQSFIVYLQADNVELTFQIPEPMTVEQFLQEVEVEWDENDRVVPPVYTQIVDGTRITIVRVEESEECETQEIPYGVQTVYNEAFQPDEIRISQSGQNGSQRICYRITYQDGVQTNRIVIGQPEVVIEPIDEIRVVGIRQEVEPIPITGTLAYINNNNAWVIQRSSVDKRRVTASTDLDSLVFNMSPDGRYLLFTRKPSDTESFVNELWLIDLVANTDPVRLMPTDVLYAEWLANAENTISYSTSEAQEMFPGWDALNNVWVARIDPNSGDTFAPQLVVPESAGGLYGWWGTVFKWAPDGSRLAWTQAEGMGIFGDEGEQITLSQYASFRNLQNWSWRANISWSWDGSLLATTVHGAPLGTEPPDRSPVFNVVVASADGSFVTTVVEGAGMWTAPTFSPQLQTPSAYPLGYLAYLKARDPNNSVSGEYDLVVADRDGSNPRSIFPAADQPGITWTDFGVVPQDYVWSPDGRQIAVVYQGNIWIVDISSGAAYQMTFDGGSEHPTWSGS
jgi:resuscitation-promoting factor RpfB